MRLIDLSNSRRGNLTIISRGPTKHYKSTTVTTWECLCDCGTKKYITSPNLKKVRSCGSYQCEYYAANRDGGRRNTGTEKHPLNWGRRGFRLALGHYRNTSKRRGIPFLLTEDHCGGPPSNFHSCESQRAAYLYSGIDRIDSALGYVQGNVQPCCWICNRMKNTLNDVDFFGHMKLIIRFSKGAKGVRAKRAPRREVPRNMRLFEPE